MGKKKELDKNEIINLYRNNLSCSEIARRLDVNVSTISSRLRSYGIDIKQYRKYSLNDDFFERIDNEYKSYWLGFIMADGYNSGKFIRIDIKDQGHLEKLRDKVYTNGDMPVREKLNNLTKIYYLTIQSPKLVSDIEKLGVVKCKSMIVSYPNINHEYDRCFIRGVFDGDGCLTYSMDGSYRRYTFSIVGGYELVKTIREKILLIGVNVGFRKTKSIYELNIRGNKQILKVLDWMYDGSSIHLDRKYKKYKDMLDYNNNNK